MDIKDCLFPNLATPYADALEKSVSFVFESFRPIAIVAAGTIVHGAGDPSSDIDLFVIHKEPFKQRLQRRFSGVPVEIFVNAASTVRDYFIDEHKRARPVTAHMLATGFVILNSPEMTDLRSEAAAWLKKPSPYSPQDERWARYDLATIFEDASDVVGRDPALARAILGELIPQLIRHYLRVRNGVGPRRKEMLSIAHKTDPEFAALAQSAIMASHIDEQLALARQLAIKSIGTDGFFEWDSDKHGLGP